MSRHRKTLRRMAQLRELAALGVSRRRSSDILSISYVEACRLSRLAGITKNYDRAGWQAVLDASKSRAAPMAALYRDGYTLEQIGQQYGITRERVRQLLKKHQRMTGGDGGQHVRAERQKVKRDAAREAKYYKMYGCSFEQWVAIRDHGRDMMASGVGRYRSPLGAYRSQKRNAGLRGIGFELTLWQWWTIWQQSGHWEQRGRGQGYVMCRNGDAGPYAIGNVYIATAAHNSSEGQNKKKRDPSLPIGVARLSSGRFTAHRRFNGRTLHLGSYETPELAHAAYLMATQPDFVPAPVRQGWAAPGTKGYMARGGRYYAYVYRGKKQVSLGSFDTADEARAAHLAAKAERAAA